MSIRLVNREELASRQLPGDTQLACDFFAALLEDSSDSLVSNISTQAKLIEVGQHVLPMTVNDRQLQNSWVCSPYNAAVTYPLDELKHVEHLIVRMGLRTLIYAIAPWLRLGAINKAVCANNWLLSTNLYPLLGEDDIRELTRSLCDQHPNHALLFRSLNHVTNSAVLGMLRDAGYLLVPSRQVYLYDAKKPDFLQRTNTKRDLKLLDTTEFIHVQHDDFSEADDPRIRELYDALYLHKYSFHNPQFTERLIRIWRESKLMTLFGLKDRSDQLVAVVGTIEMNGVLTAPLVGYDTTQPQRSGLYRILMAHVFKKTVDKGRILNLSAGAASFKKLRGGQPEIEYSAVYCCHLPLRQRIIWKALASLFTEVGARVLTRYEL